MTTLPHIASRVLGTPLVIGQANVRNRLHAGRGLADVLGEIGELDNLDREREHARRAQPVQMLVDRLRLRTGVGEYRTVRHRLDLAMGRHQRHGRRLDAGAERDHMHD